MNTLIIECLDKDMAKITRYTKDTAGEYLLTIAAVALIFWCTMAGLDLSTPPGSGQQAAAVQQAEETGGTGAVWYYLGGPVVGILWGLASYERDPSGFGNQRMAAIIR